MQHTLATEDTFISISFQDNSVIIDGIESTTEAKNWVPDGSPVALMSACELDGAFYSMNWQFTGITKWTEQQRTDVKHDMAINH